MLIKACKFIKPENTLETTTVLMLGLSGGFFCFLFDWVLGIGPDFFCQLNISTTDKLHPAQTLIFSEVLFKQCKVLGNNDEGIPQY